MANHLEPGIKDLVEDFQSNGKPCPSLQTIEERRTGYIGSTVLAGKSPKIEHEFLDTLNGVQIKVYKPTTESNLPITVYFHGGCFISGGFETHDVQLRQIALQSNSIVICINIDWHLSIHIQRRTTMCIKLYLVSRSLVANMVAISNKWRLLVIVPVGN